MHTFSVINTLIYKLMKSSIIKDKNYQYLSCGRSLFRKYILYRRCQSTQKTRPINTPDITTGITTLGNSSAMRDKNLLPAGSS